MSKTIVICGYGPGISAAVARRFGREGFQVALVARSEQRLTEGVAALEASGVRAVAVRGDLSKEAAVESALDSVRASLGPISVLHWNAYSTSGGDLFAVDAEVTRAIFDIPVIGLLAAVKYALPDLEQAKDGALLVTNGGFGLNDPVMDERAVAFGAMGLGLANAAKRKLVGIRAQAQATWRVRRRDHGAGLGQRLGVGQRHGDARGGGRRRRVLRSVLEAQRHEPKRTLSKTRRQPLH
jgi:NAD(P)-dependent dehydrogenase (short-subunit alcohol dehydrogenase family)